MKKLNIKKELSELNEWVNCSQNRRIMFDMSTAEIEDLLAGNVSLDSVGSISSRMDRMAFWYVQNALSKAGNDQEVLHRNWSSYLDFIRHSMKMRVVRIEHPGGIGSIGALETQRHFNLLCGSGLIDEAAWLGLRIYESIKRRVKHPVVYELREISEADLDRPLTGDNDPRNLNRESISGYTDSPICGFVLRMWLILTGRREPSDRLPEKAPQCGVYEALFEHWDNPSKLPAAIMDATDFHVRRMQEDRRIPYDIAEFDTSPFRQIPFEILAYRNLRRHLGLETPFPAHPLLDSPFV